MKYDLSTPKDKELFKNYYDKLLSKGAKVELKEVKVTRSQRQNRSLHLLFSMISNELNELGMEFQYFGVKGQVLSTRYTAHIVKEHFYRPIQIALFDIQSTTKVDTKQINENFDVVAKFFSDRGVEIFFPSIESMTD